MFLRSDGKSRVAQLGQVTVEAAFLLPALLVLLGVFIQPAILLYDRCVMNAAAAEGCRAVETATSSGSATKAYVLRRLGAVPCADAFHKGGKTGWTVEVSGAELSGSVKVKISHSVKLLPFLGIAAGLAAQSDGAGGVKQEVEAVSSLAPGWAQSSGGGPDDWIGRWQ